MTPPQTDILPQLTELSASAFEAFCNDISGMFGVEMASRMQSGCRQTVKGLVNQFKKLSAVINVRAKGILQGDFYIVFDKEALFTLAGTIVMLPEQRIQSIRKSGTAKDAEELHDAVAETGNLLVGSWDRVFREGLQGHIHFLQTATYIGNPWDNSEKNIGLSDNKECLFFPCEITLGSFPAFNSGVIFPEAVVHPALESPKAPEAQPPVSSNSQDTQTEQSGTSAEPVSNVQTEQTVGGSVSETIQKMVQSLPVLPLEHVHALFGVCARDIMQKEVLWGQPEDSVGQVMEKMRQADGACILIGAPGSLQGIITWIDIAEAVSVYLRPAFAKWRRPADDATLQIKSKVMMSRPVRTIKPQTSLAVILEDMCQHRLRCLPVVNEQNVVAGVVTAFDIFKYMLKMSPDFSMADLSSR